MTGERVFARRATTQGTSSVLKTSIPTASIANARYRRAHTPDGDDYVGEGFSHNFASVPAYAKPMIQRKALQVASPTDPMEQEADRVAVQIVDASSGGM